MLNANSVANKLFNMTEGKAFHLSAVLPHNWHMN